MHYILSITGLVASIAMLKYRQQCGDFLGETDWMHYVGGIYNVVIILALFIFFWSLAVLTGTTDILFTPFLYLFPGLANPGSHSVIVDPGVVQ